MSTQTEGKHTPGPWDLSGSTVYALEQDGWHRGEPRMVNRFTAHVQTTKLSLHEEVMANARLIAAAPDMYEALNRVRDDIDDETMPETVRIIEAALSKAEGQS